MATPELCASRFSSVVLDRFCVLCELGGVDKDVGRPRGEAYMCCLGCSQCSREPVLIVGVVVSKTREDDCT